MAAIIFDFDGTVADSFEVIVDIFEGLVKRPNRLSEEEIAELRGYPISVLVKRLHLPWWRVPYLLLRGRHIMGKRLREIPTFAGMPRVIDELHAQGHELFIVSSNSARNVRKFLKQHHLYKYFVEVHGNAGLVSHGKSKVLRRVLRGNHLAAADCIYIGDETRDIEATKAVNMRCIAVSWGFAERAFLEQHQPTAMADEPQDIVRIIDEL